MARNNIEDDHQINLIKWSKFQTIPGTDLKIFDLLIHVPNGGSRNAKEGAKFKRMGVQAGYPDLTLFYPNHPFYGLMIEMKAPIVPGKPKPRVQPEQKKWIKRLKDQGYLVAVCYGWHEARELICNYLKIKHK